MKKMDPSLKRFLLDRGVELVTLEHMENENVDAEAIVGMGTEGARQFFPKLGDLHATISFCRRMIEGECTKTKNDFKESLVDKLKKKLETYGSKRKKMSKSPESHSQNTPTETVNKGKRREKSTRKIYLGWIHNGVQVRTTHGGGTRIVDVAKSDRKVDLLEKALNLFFRDGKSSKGYAEEFQFNIVDFERKTFDEDITVQEIFELTELTNLRFYLTSEDIDEKDANRGKTETENEHENIDTSNEQLVGQQIKHNLLELPDELFESLSQTSCPQIPPSPSSSLQVMRNKRSIYVLSSDDSEAESDFLESSTKANQVTELIEPPALSDEIFLTIVDRDKIFETLIETYSLTNIQNKQIKTIFMNESGVDSGGLTKELFALFWKEAEKMFFIGEDAIVPSLSLHRRRKDIDKFRILGQILEHGFCLTKMIPAKICKSSLITICKPNSTIGNDIVLEDFMLFLTLHERKLIKKALKHYDSLSENEINELTNLFMTYDLHENPTQKEIQDQISTIANEIIQVKPRELLQEISKGFVHLDFWSKITLDELCHHLTKQGPTNKKVVECLTTEGILTEKQEKVFYFLQTYIHSLTKEDLENFLLFVTGSTLMPNMINVIFNNVTGEAMAPKSNTCSNNLHLSIGYTNYSEFKLNMNSHLNSEYSFQYANL